jgi:hypothetical protein
MQKILISESQLKNFWSYKERDVAWRIKTNDKLDFFCFCGAVTQRGSWPPHSWGFLDHTQRRTTVGRTPLDEWSARRRDLYLKTHNTHKRQTSMPLLGSEPTISAGERPQTYSLDCAAIETGCGTSLRTKIKSSDFVARRSCNIVTNQVAACWTFDFNWALLYRLYIWPYVQFRLAQYLTGAEPSDL